MCTIVLAWQVFPETPLVVAANRDEAVDRPSAPPERSGGDPAVVAPRDREAGGTWIGYSDRGVVAALTNRWTDQDRRGDRSRGLLVDDLLREPTAEAAVRRLESDLDDRSYEGFNLVVADAFGGMDDPPDPFRVHPPADREDPAAAVLVEYDGQVRTTVLEPGVHVVVNVGADGNYVVPAARPEAARRQAENADRLRAELTPEPGESAVAWRDRAAEALADHDFGVCVHRDGFGTRSSSLLTVGEGGVRYRFADGPPCETDYEDVSASV